MIISLHLHYFLSHRSVEAKDYKWWEDLLGTGTLSAVSSDYWISTSRERQKKEKKNLKVNKNTFAFLMNITYFMTPDKPAHNIV